MAAPELFDVDPGQLRLPPARWNGADAGKLQRQIKRFGTSTAGMPRLIVFRLADDELMIFDGVTRATRVAKLLPGQLVPVEVIGRLAGKGSSLPTVRDRLP